jgi:hypothetical protein
MRRTILAITTAAVLAAAPGYAAIYHPPSEARAPTGTSATPSQPVLIMMPNVVGQNAAVAQQTLQQLGFTNVDLSPVDGHDFVLLPQDWTVKSQTAKAGSQLMADAVIVLGVAKN